MAAGSGSRSLRNAFLTSSTRLPITSELSCAVLAKRTLDGLPMTRVIAASVLSLLIVGCVAQPSVHAPPATGPVGAGIGVDTLPDCTNEFNCYVSSTADVCPDRKYIYDVRTFATVDVRDSGTLVRSDGRGPYVHGKDNVYA